MTALLADCSGAIIAGGLATRLGGVRKAFLEVEGEPIVARTLRLFGSLFAGALIVANERGPYEHLGVPVVADRIAGKGAPGGLHAALSAAVTPWVFAVACDMPRLSAPAITALAERRAGASAVMVRWRGRPEPLFAFYARECLPALDALLRAGDPSFVQLARAVGARMVEEDEWRTVDPQGVSFENLNTPEDAARVRARTPSAT